MTPLIQRRACSLGLGIEARHNVTTDRIFVFHSLQLEESFEYGVTLRDKNGKANIQIAPSINNSLSLRTADREPQRTTKITLDSKDGNSLRESKHCQCHS